MGEGGLVESICSLVMPVRDRPRQHLFFRRLGGRGLCGEAIHPLACSTLRELVLRGRIVLVVLVASPP